MSEVLEVRTDDPRATRVVGGAPAPLAEGEVLLRVERFALSANNITYGTLGDSLGYWRIFPTEPGWGRLPVWGHAEVVASAHPDVARGRRLFGYVPMGSHLVVTPGRVSARGLTDTAPHRASLAPAYNAYRWLDADPLHDPAHPDEVPLFLPVFVLSFLLDAFLADHGLFGARTVVVSSASSKASLGIAHLLSARGVDVVGVTSPRNAAFVESVGVYGTTVTYDRVAELAGTPSVFVDVAGNAAVSDAVHARLGDRLAHSTIVGATHWTTPPGGQSESKWFFAPDHMRQRITDWGADEFDRRFGAALRTFAAWSRNWLTITHSTGPAEVRSTYLNVLDGAAEPSVGHLLSMPG